MSAESNLVNVGRITAVYGVKGWVKVHSYTEPQESSLVVKNQAWGQKN